MGERVFKNPERGLVRTATAAKELGVDRQMLDGLVQAGRIPGRVEHGKSGSKVVFIDLARLRALLSAD